MHIISIFHNLSNIIFVIPIMIAKRRESESKMLINNLCKRGKSEMINDHDEGVTSI